MLKINVETIPHSCQRYETCGDWVFEPDGTLNVNVSELSQRPSSGSPVAVNHEDSEFLVAIHEIIEAYLCKKRGITTEMVDQFDMNWTPKKELGIDEPGDDPAAPYHLQHIQAESIERMLANAFGLSWHEHKRRIDAL